MEHSNRFFVLQVRFCQVPAELKHDIFFFQLFNFIGTNIKAWDIR